MFCFKCLCFATASFCKQSIARPFLSASSIRTFQPAQFFGFSHSIVCRHASSEVSSVCFPQLPASTHAATLYFAWHSVCHFLRGGYVCICRPSEHLCHPFRLAIFLLARFSKFHSCVHRLQSSSHALCRITPCVATLLQRSGLRVPRPPVSTHALFHILPLVDSMFLQKDRLCAPCSHLAPVLYFA